MDFRHRVAFSCHWTVADRIESLTVEVVRREPRDNGQTYIAFDVCESHPKWQELEELVPEDILDTCVATVFAKEEIEAAEWLTMSGGWFHGYPQPNGNYEYKHLTYDDADMCSGCHGGLVQKGPFRVYGEPAWKRRQIMQLNWIYDEFFVSPEVWERVFKPFGLDKWPVAKNRKGELYESVVQLKIDYMSPSRLRLCGHPLEICKTCGRVRYRPFVRGMLPGPEEFPDAPIFKTLEVFGSGWQNYRRVIISRQLFRAIQEHDLKGARFSPVDTAKR